MKRKKAKIKFYNNSFNIIEEGEFVICAISGREIPIEQLSYWNVDLQEAYYSAKEANERYKNLKNDT